MILNRAQAEAVYSAMCALNNVSGLIDCRMSTNILGRDIRVYQRIMSDEVVVTYSWGGAVRASERYVDQVAFAVGHGIE